MTHKCEFVRVTRGSTGSLVPKKCSRPQLRMCSVCSKIIDVRCKATRVEVCGYCAKIWLSQRKQQITEPLLRHKEHVEMTLTADGVKKYPWDTQYCTHSQNVRCSGPIGCRVSDEDASEWNGSLSRRFNDFMTNLRRQYPYLDFQYFKVRETKRELNHIHLAGVAESGLPAFATYEEKKTVGR